MSYTTKCPACHKELLTWNVSNVLWQPGWYWVMFTLTLLYNDELIYEAQNFTFNGEKVNPPSKRVKFRYYPFVAVPDEVMEQVKGYLLKNENVMRIINSFPPRPKAPEKTLSRLVKLDD